MTTNPPATTYLPRGNSKPAKALAFFKANPEETLTADDFAAKFDMQRNNVHTIMRPALDAGLLKRKRDDLGEYVYTAAAALAGFAVDALETDNAKTADPALDCPAAPWPNAPGGRSKTAKPYSPLHIGPAEFAALTVDTHVPFQPAGSSAGAKWAPLFDLLTSTGQSVAYPIAWHSAVSASAQKRNQQAKAPEYVWRVRKVSATQGRLWKLAK